MNVAIYTPEQLTVSAQQIRRYAGNRGQPLQPELSAMADEICRRICDAGGLRVCYLTLPLQLSGDQVCLGALRLHSSALARNLSGCERACLFCATVGPVVDRGILRSRLHPAQAMLWDAIGSAAVEQVCDEFCAWLGGRQHPRFSPGYGDLPLSCQGQLLSVLDAAHHVGVTLTDAMLMTPTKSVTAIAGLEGEEKT